jgi:hypothetical protein
MGKSKKSVLKVEPRRLGSYFKKLNRAPEGCASRAVTTTDDRPEWLQEAIREAHVSDLPRDWIYQECEAVCDAIDEGSLKDEVLGYQEDAIHEYADSRVDIYTKDRYEWAADMCLTGTYAEAESEWNDGGQVGATDTTEKLGALQYYACARIARIILEAWEASKLEEVAS